MLVRLDDVASIIVNANDGIVRSAEKLCVIDGVACRVRSIIPQPTERQHIADQIKAAMIRARADFVNLFGELAVSPS